MKLKLIYLFSLFSLFLQAQEELGYFNTKKGERVSLYSSIESTSDIVYDQYISGNIALTGQFVYYYDITGKRIKIPQRKVERLEFGNQLYINLRIGSKWGFERLHEVIAENDKYILTNYYFKGYFFYVFNKRTEKFEEKKVFNSRRKNADLKLIDKKIKPYFKACKDLIVQLRDNVEVGNYKNFVKYNVIEIRKNLFGSISNFQCD